MSHLHDMFPRFQDIMLADVWPTPAEVADLENNCVKPEMFVDVYSRVTKGTDRWNSLEVVPGKNFQWEESST